MGACYNVKLKLKFKNELDLIQVLQRKIKNGESESIDYSISTYGASEIPTDLNGLVSVFLVFHQNMFEIISDESGVKEYESAFNASYGWEMVMVEMFQELAPYLEDDSELWIYPDSDYDYLVVKNGESIWIH